MNKLDITVLEQIQVWRKKGLEVVLVTVAHTWGSSPRPIGSMLAWCANGQFVGSVSGGCIEDDLLKEFAEQPPKKVELRSYGVSAAKAASRGLPCGGRLEVVIEPLLHEDDTSSLLKAVAGRKRLQRSLNIVSGALTSSPAKDDQRTRMDGDVFHAVFEAEWRLLIIGAGELSQFVNQFGRALGFATLVCDPRENYRDSWPDSDTQVCKDMPDDFILESRCDAQTAVVALTHDPKIDDMAILEALNTSAFYIGALGSKRTNDARRLRLAEHFEVSQDKLAFMRGPIGIDLNTRSAAEIALSVVTEIIARRNGVSLASKRLI